MKTKEKQEALVEAMKSWQKLEHQTIVQTAKIRGETDNPLIGLVMEIIQHDSTVHHRVQQLIVDSLEKQTVSVNPAELEGIWTSIEEHIKMERETVELGKKSLEALEGTKNVVQLYLLNYLIADEEKHDKLLSNLELIKKGMYP